MTMGIDFIRIFVDRDLSQDNFTSCLFRLMAKADRANLNRIEKGFPKECELFYWWRGHTKNPSKDEIFRFAEDLDKNESTIPK